MNVYKLLGCLIASSAWAGGTMSALTQEGNQDYKSGRPLLSLPAEEERRHPILTPAQRKTQAAAYVKTQQFRDSAFGQLVQENDPEKLRAYEKAHPLDKNLQAFYANHKGHLVQTSYAFMYQLSKNARLRYWEDLYDFKLAQGSFSPPWEMGYCSELHTLHLSRVSVLDLETGLDLKKLKEIKLTACDITGPQFLKDSPQIEIYRLQSMLSETALDFSPFANLTFLELSNNPKLRIFPDVRGKAGLKRLYLSHTNIAEIPEWIGELTALYAFNLFRTPVRRLPSQILGCKDLRNLWLPVPFPALDGKCPVEQARDGLIGGDSDMGWVVNLPAVLNHLEDRSKAQEENANLLQEIQALRSEVAQLKAIVAPQDH